MNDYDILLTKKKQWYSQTFVRFEIIKCLRRRELCLLTKKEDPNKSIIRYLLAFNLEYLDKHFERFEFYKSLANLYHSVSVLENVPVFSYNLKERRKEEEYREFNQNYDKYVTGYNLFIDIDGKENFEEAYKDALALEQIFNEHKLPYYVLNSSFKGFHFHIPYNYLPNLEIYDLLSLINAVIGNLKAIFYLKNIDASIFDIKRLCKVPYSFSADGAICLPLTHEQLRNFNQNMVKPENVLSKVRIMNRGLLLRKHGLTDEELRENVVNLMEEFK